MTNRLIQGVSQRGSVRRAVSAGLISIALMAATIPAVLAATVNLEKIDFLSSPGVTDVILHTGAKVPTNIVLATENKLVIDIHDVRQDSTVRTDFVDAINISHVVVQPISDTDIRLIIRGESLAAPRITYGAIRTEDGGPTGSLRDLPAVSSLQVPHAHEGSGNRPPLTEQGRKIRDDIAADHGILDQDTVLAEKTQPILKPDARDISGMDDPREKPESEGVNGFIRQSGGLILQIALLIGIAIGFIAFLRNKLISLRFDKPRHTVSSAQTPGGATAGRGGIGALLNAYRDSKTNDGPAEDIQPQRPAARQPQRGDSLIGLGALHVSEEPVIAQQPNYQSVQNRAQQELMQQQAPKAGYAQRPAAPRVKPPQAPSQQVVSQYRQQEGLPPAQPVNQSAMTRKRRVDDTILQQEIERARGQQRQVNNPSPREPQQAAKPFTPPQAARRVNQLQPVTNPAKNGPLPDNPEVLNFLRNVADLMEKEGKPNLARSIQKNINPS
ncbi:MAG: hypothetical protein AB7P76_12300 [Candidatus Melainabacteria bacterium]